MKKCYHTKNFLERGVWIPTISPIQLACVESDEHLIINLTKSDAAAAAVPDVSSLPEEINTTPGAWYH